MWTDNQRFRGVVDVLPVFPLSVQTEISAEPFLLK